MNIEIIGLFVLLVGGFALAYRARGGAIPLGSTTLARLVFWFVPVTIASIAVATSVNAPWWVGLISGLAGFVMQMLGHGFAQNRDSDSEAEMGLVTFTRLLVILAPFCLYSPYLPLYALIGFLAWPLARLSYSKFFDSASLEFAGIVWCRPHPIGGSEWEELFVGAVFGLTYFNILIS